MGLIRIIIKLLNRTTLCAFLYALCLIGITQAAVRYVSHSGSNTPPYLTWETAADSIMSAVNISSFGDTIYVANGVYEEVIDMINGLSLIGSGSDSCIIDTRGFTNFPGYTIKVVDTCIISSFGIRSKDVSNGDGIVITGGANTIIKYCRIQEAKYGIDIYAPIDNRPLVFNNTIFNVTYGIITLFAQSTISNNNVYAAQYGLVSQLNSTPTYLNNIVVLDDINSHGFGSGFDLLSVVENNLFVALNNDCEFGIISYSDSIINNNIYGPWQNGAFVAGSILENNNIQKSIVGMRYDVGGGTAPVFQYNNLWNNQTNYQNFTADSTNIYSDPMFENEDSMNFHLQMYSPLIDAGDPGILDKDGSRSDIGLFGGPYGEKYTYRDLAPKPPSNLTATYDSGLVLLRWNRNTEADFYHYRVYRDTSANFTYDSTRMIAEIADTFYYDDLPEKYLAKNYYYKLTAIDTAGHQSAPSEEVQVNITGVPEGPPRVVKHYQLLNNYPNPFNSGTIIPYRLKEGGYVKLYIYDIKGELVRVLVNEYQSAGYYEVRFNPTTGERKQGQMGEGWWTGYNDDIATGIYLYQIMVRGEGNVPVFTDMGKMILLK